MKYIDSYNMNISGPESCYPECVKDYLPCGTVLKFKCDNAYTNALYIIWIVIGVLTHVPFLLLHNAYNVL